MASLLDSNPVLFLILGTLLFFVAGIFVLAKYEVEAQSGKRRIVVRPAQRQPRTRRRK